MYPYEPHSGTHPAPYWLRDDCHSKHYRDPYMNSFSCDDQLPLISSIGRGPRGAGITAKLLKDTDTEFIFSLVDDETGEQVFQSPNLAPAIVSISAPKHTPIAGENYPITFSMRRGTDVSEYTVDIPSGAQGSLIYCLEDPIHLNSTTENENSGMWFKLANLGDTTFRTTIDHLLIYGDHNWTDKPIPRVNDIIFCPYWAEKQDGYSIGVSFGTIEAVENGTVVWTARTFVPSSDIGLSENGTWIINGKDSGFVAKGEKGDTGPQGAQGVKGEKGDPFTYADFTEAQILELQRPATEAAADAKAAIAEVKATEAKLYPAAENVLVGSETGTVAHVEDAFAGASLRKITIEGACKQDGTPSPDNPVPIEVVENPVVKVTGMNMFDISKIRVNDSIPYGINISVEDGYIILQGTASGIEDSNVNPSFTLGWYVDNSLSGKGLSIMPFGAPSNVRAYGIRTADETQISIATSLRNGDKVDWKIQIAVSKGESKEYKPHTSQTLTFALPPEHPYLAKLPDGKADEIVVDGDGNVELVARVGVDKDVRKIIDFKRGEYYSLETNLSPFASEAEDYSGIMLCSVLRSKTLTSNNEGIYRTWNGVYVHDTSGRTKDEIQAEVDKNAPLTVVGPIPTTRYQLGKIEMPKTQDSIVNVWTDAEVTPRTGIQYVRDVNIIVAKIEERITKVEQALLERATDEDIDEMFLAK